MGKRVVTGEGNPAFTQPTVPAHRALHSLRPRLSTQSVMHSPIHSLATGLAWAPLTNQVRTGGREVGLPRREQLPLWGSPQGVPQGRGQRILGKQSICIHRGREGE